jgi:MFS family permease
MLLCSIALCSLLNLLTPKFAAFGNWQGVVFLRVVQGAIQGVIFPSTHTLLAKWVRISFTTLVMNFILIVVIIFEFSNMNSGTNE